MIALLLSFSLQTTPIQSQYLEEAIVLGRTSISAAVCVQAQMIQSTGLDIRAEYEKLEQRASSDGVSSSDIRSAINQSINTETRTFASLLSSEDDEQTKIDKMLNYLTNRCNGVLRNYPDYFQPINTSN